MKEAYDVLRNVEKRKKYDEEMRLTEGQVFRVLRISQSGITQEGFLMEASSSRFSNNRIVNRQAARNEAYSGPSGTSGLL